MTPSPQPPRNVIVSVSLPLMGGFLGSVTINGFWQDPLRINTPWKEQRSQVATVWKPVPPPVRGF